MIPVPPSANPDGIFVTIAITYGNAATTAKNGAPNQFIRIKTLVICLSVSAPDLTPGINFPLFWKFSLKFCGLI
jgi:hypothetical protein